MDSNHFPELERGDVLDLSPGEIRVQFTHCPACFLNYKLSVVRGLRWGPVVVNLIGVGGNRWATTSSNTWATSFNSSSKAIIPTKMSVFIDLQKKWDKTTNSFVVFHFLFCSCIFFCVCAGSQIQFFRSLNRLPQIISGVCSDYLMPLLIQCQVMVD